ncbi:MAG: hypothetical protein IPP10_15385 [Candidatus Competibacteraceae bacterium]|nr:hypothetical protein [Candidatus Competibacteraceae bacterium]
MLRSLLLSALLVFPVFGVAARDLPVGWDYSTTTVEWFEFQWRNPTTWNQMIITSRTIGNTVLDTNLRYLVPTAVSGSLEIWCRACRARMAGEEAGCISPMVAGWTTSCCSEWATLIVNEPSTPTKPVINP